MCVFWHTLRNSVPVVYVFLFKLRTLRDRQNLLMQYGIFEFCILKVVKKSFYACQNAVSISLLLEYIIRVLSLNFYYKWYYFSDLLEFNCDISHTDIYATVTFFYCFIKVPQYIKTCTLLDTTSQDLNAKNVNLLYFFQL